jgi:hypothetical protein
VPCHHPQFALLPSVDARHEKRHEKGTLEAFKAEFAAKRASIGALNLP